MLRFTVKRCSGCGTKLMLAEGQRAWHFTCPRKAAGRKRALPEYV